MSMPSWKRIAAACCLLAGVGGAAQLKFHFDSGSDGLVRLGRPLPSLRVDGDGGEFDLRRAVAGQRSVVVFYSATCRVCQEELPALQPFPETLRLILVNESRTPGKDVEPAVPGAASFRDHGGVLLRSFAIVVLPTILFVDEHGILREGLLGAHGREQLQRRLKEFASRSYEP
jgi:hypothetical protein